MKKNYNGKKYWIDLISILLENVIYDIIIIYSLFKVIILKMNESYVNKPHKDDSHFTMVRGYYCLDITHFISYSI